MILAVLFLCLSTSCWAQKINSKDDFSMRVYQQYAQLEKKEPTLLSAIIDKDGPMIKHLLDGKFDPNEKDADGVNCLMWCVLKNNYETFEELTLCKTIDINAQSSLGFNALMSAIILKQKKMIHLLLDHKGCDLTRVDHTNKTALNLAQNAGELEDVMKKMEAMLQAKLQETASNKKPKKNSWISCIIS